jgi:hypothetical protein
MCNLPSKRLMWRLCLSLSLSLSLSLYFYYLVSTPKLLRQVFFKIRNGILSLKDVQEFRYLAIQVPNETWFTYCHKQPSPYIPQTVSRAGRYNSDALDLDP